jgi:hypothetical protein
MEVDLEIEEPGAANSVAEEGAKSITHEQYVTLNEQLKKARAKKENKIGEGGFEIAFLDPSKFENTMKVVTMADASEEQTEAQSFNM